MGAMQAQPPYTYDFAKEYLKQLPQNPEFKQSFLNEKARLDMEYQLEELKRDVAVCKPVNELIGKI